MTVSVYSDRPWEKGNIKMVLRRGNLFIDTGGKYNVIDETSNIQLIDDHYSAMDESVYQDERFQYDKYMPENFKADYRSRVHSIQHGGQGLQDRERLQAAEEAAASGLRLQPCSPLWQPATCWEFSR